MRGCQNNIDKCGYKKRHPRPARGSGKIRHHVAFALPVGELSERRAGKCLAVRCNKCAKELLLVASV